MESNPYIKATEVHHRRGNMYQELLDVAIKRGAVEFATLTRDTTADINRITEERDALQKAMDEQDAATTLHKENQALSNKCDEVEAEMGKPLDSYVQLLEERVCICETETFTHRSSCPVVALRFKADCATPPPAEGDDGGGKEVAPPWAWKEIMAHRREKTTLNAKLERNREEFRKIANIEAVDLHSTDEMVTVFEAVEALNDAYYELNREVAEKKAECVGMQRGHTELEEQLENETRDLQLICGEVTKVYDAVSCGKFTKPNTAAGYVIDEVADRQQKAIDEALRDAKEVSDAELEAMASQRDDLDSSWELRFDELAKELERTQGERNVYHSFLETVVKFGDETPTGRIQTRVNRMRIVAVNALEEGAKVNPAPPAKTLGEFADDVADKLTADDDRGVFAELKTKCDRYETALNDILHTFKGQNILHGSQLWNVMTLTNAALNPAPEPVTGEHKDFVVMDDVDAPEEEGEGSMPQMTVNMDEVTGEQPSGESLGTKTQGDGGDR